MGSSPLRLAIFLSVIGTVTGLLHGYAWLRLVHDPSWPALPTALGTALAVMLAVGLPAAMMLARSAPARVAVPLAWAAFVWLGTIFYVDVSLAVLDAGRLLFEGVASASAGVSTPEGPTAARALALTAMALGLSIVSVGVWRGRSAPIVRRVRVPIAGLPAAFEGFRIAQLTDVHVSAITRRPAIERLVHATNALGADLIAITGDLVDGSVAELREHVAPIAELRAPSGVFFVTGNHEYFSGADAWSAHVESLGIEVLRNRHVRVEKDGEAITLAGIDDAIARQFGGRSDVDGALAGRDPSLPVVLLAHQPRSVEKAARAGVALQISGHTHGGQMQPFSLLVRIEQPFLRGLHRVGETAVWVSEGTGTWGPPMRVGTRSEISLIELTAAL